MSRTRRYAWPILVTTSAATMIVIFMLGVGPPISVIVALWFLTVCPGVPFVRLLRIDDRLMAVILTVALSMSIVAVTSIPLLWAGIWTPARALALVFTITLAGAIADVWSLGSPAQRPQPEVLIMLEDEGA